ncbi:MAG: toll/interleukin-1 receptor domain-containing protein [Chloroflexota bacterium]
MARKLASHYQAALILPGDGHYTVDTLVTIVDGTDLAIPLASQNKVQAQRRLLVTLGVEGGLLQPLFATHQIIDLGDATIFEAFKQIRLYLDEDEPQPILTSSNISLQSAFISHAVKDEPLILPVADYVRTYFKADLFLCADSIPPGVNWHDKILNALHTQHTFVFLLSEATLASHFCSFEIGFAYALEKPMVLLSLDGSRPPAFIQHIQAIDLPRIEQQKPWLDQTDILLEALLDGVVEK